MILKLFINIYFILFTVSGCLASCIKEIQSEVDRDSNCSRSLLKLEQLPSHIIYLISDYLEGENKQGRNDFANFAVISKSIYQKIITNHSLFSPVNKQDIISYLQNHSYDELHLITFKWSRVKKMSLLATLDELSMIYNDHDYTVPMTLLEYEEKMHNFEMFLKLKIVSFF